MPPPCPPPGSGRGTPHCLHLDQTAPVKPEKASWMDVAMHILRATWPALHGLLLTDTHVLVCVYPPGLSYVLQTQLPSAASEWGLVPDSGGEGVEVEESQGQKMNIVLSSRCNRLT